MVVKIPAKNPNNSVELRLLKFRDKEKKHKKQKNLYLDQKLKKEQKFKW